MLKKTTLKQCLSLALILLFAPLSAVSKIDRDLRLNEIQLVGSHNSYKKKIDSVLLFMLKIFDSKISTSLDYEHLTLVEQLDLGLRSLELDVYYDPVGGHYSAPFGSKLGPFSSAYDEGEVMKYPGFKVLHVQDIDYRSHCLTLKICLEQIKKWSSGNPQHLPLVITVNPKDDIIPQDGFDPPMAFDAGAWNSLDVEFLDTLAKHLIIPDDIRGFYKTLKESILAGWPSVNSLRGKVLFVLDAPTIKNQEYVVGHPELGGRVMFVNFPEQSSMSSFRVVNDPIENLEYIKGLVQRGFIVRTRADAETVESRNGDTRRLRSAIKSGAQIISTDYYKMDDRHGTSYEVKFFGSDFFQCNPSLISGTCELHE
ncbi:MAG: hypothetical protein ACI9CE_002289 [Flavobacterium sp.]|jgi:hypothetical protein